MKFHIIDSISGIDRDSVNECFLVVDNWDDWFEFSTMYRLYFVTISNTIKEIGFVKIGQFLMKEGQRRPLLNRDFENLEDNYFSVGQDEKYYENIRSLDEHFRIEILSILNDFAFSNEMFQKALGEKVTRVSLLRSVSEKTISEQFRRILLGGAAQTSFNFSYSSPMYFKNPSSKINLTFNVNPDSSPPSNIHVLIGRNGVGKTTLLSNMANAALNSDDGKYGSFSSSSTDERVSQFSGLITVSYSAFDDFTVSKEKRDNTNSLRYSYIGLKEIKKVNGIEIRKNKSMESIDSEFARSLFSCVFTVKKEIWISIIAKLKYDPIFSEANVTELSNYSDKETFKKNAIVLFKKLSSGHKIVLLTLTKLIELIEEKSLVLIDEPEAHLHPPLLSAYIRTLSELLKYKNAVAIIATHSPIILQEVASDCAWVLYT